MNLKIQYNFLLRKTHRHKINWAVPWTTWAMGNHFSCQMCVCQDELWLRLSFFLSLFFEKCFSSKKTNMQQLDLSDFIGETEENKKRRVAVNQWNCFENVGDASHYLEKTAPSSVINLLTLFFRNQSYSCCDCPGTPRTSEILSFLKRLRLHSQFDWTLVCLLGNSDLFAEVWTQSEQRTNSLLPKKNGCLRLLQVQGIDKNTTSTTACAVCCPASP